MSPYIEESVRRANLPIWVGCFHAFDGELIFGVMNKNWQPRRGADYYGSSDRSTAAYLEVVRELS